MASRKRIREGQENDEGGWCWHSLEEEDGSPAPSQWESDGTRWGRDNWAHQDYWSANTRHWDASGWLHHKREGSCASGRNDTDWIVHPSGAHTSTLMFLHSCHGRPEHAASFVGDLRERAELDEGTLRVIAPAAPRRPIDSDACGTMQWFEYRTEELLEGADQDDVDKAQLVEQRKRLLVVLRDELQRLPPDGRMVIGGLSQGASMIADLLLHLEGPLDTRLRGVFFKRGFVQRESVDNLQPNASISTGVELPLVATHGLDDDWVPFRQARKSYDLLRERGWALDFHEIPGLAHNGYNDDEARILAEFVGHLLKPSGSEQ